MSQSSKTTHDFGQVSLSADILADIIDVTSVATYSVPSTESGNFITCSGYTAGTTVVTLPSIAGSSFTVVQKAASNPFAIHTTIPIYGTLVCAGTGGNVAVTGGSTITFTTNGLIGDSVTLKCDGAKYYASGLFGTIGSLTSTT